jgi:hypothetical protein
MLAIPQYYCYLDEELMDLEIDTRRFVACWSEVLVEAPIEEKEDVNVRSDASHVCHLFRRWVDRCARVELCS